MPLANTAVRGNYGGSATNPQALGVTIFSGEFSADGASPTGTIIGTQDIGAPSGATTACLLAPHMRFLRRRRTEEERFQVESEQWRNLDDLAIEIHCLVVE